MKKIIATIVLKLMGWKIQMDGDVKNLDRCILAVAPHTANIEYVLGNLAYWKLGKPLRVIIKNAHTKAWYGFIIKAMEGLGLTALRGIIWFNLWLIYLKKKILV